MFKFSNDFYIMILSILAMCSCSFTVVGVFYLIIAYGEIFDVVMSDNSASVLVYDYATDLKEGK